MSKHPYPDAPDNFRHLPDGAPSPFVDGGSTQGEQLDRFPTAGKQPMGEAGQTEPKSPAPGAK
jgi:hypothetical protein